MIKKSSTTSMCLCKDIDDKIHLIRAGRSNLECIDGRWCDSKSKSFYWLSSLTKIPVSSDGSLEVFNPSTDESLHTVIEEFIKNDNFELTYEEPIELHLKTTFELLNYTIE